MKYAIEWKIMYESLIVKKNKMKREKCLKFEERFCASTKYDKGYSETAFYFLHERRERRLSVILFLLVK